MGDLPWVLISVALGLLVTGAGLVLLWKRRKEEKPQNVDYRVFFILGIVFIVSSIANGMVFFTSDNQTFLILGLTFVAIGSSYTAIGLANRDKWTKTGKA